MKSQPFLQQLRHQVQELLVVLTTEVEPCATPALQYKPTATSWSALECLEHLNRYSRFYNQALRQALAVGRPGNAAAEVSFSWLGRKSHESVRPENLKRQTTLRHLNPNQSPLNREVLREFREHQEVLLTLLHHAEHSDLNRKAVPVEFFRWLKLQTGEALRFVVAHQQRHMQQAQCVLRQALAAERRPSAAGQLTR